MAMKKSFSKLALQKLVGKKVVLSPYNKTA